METNPLFPEVWHVSMSVNSGVSLLTRPRYAQIIARHLNKGHRDEMIITRSHMLLPDELLLLVEPNRSPLNEWLQAFLSGSAADLCETLQKDTDEQRKEWFTTFLNKDDNAPALFWKNVQQQRVSSLKEYDDLEARMLSAPVRAGYVNDPEFYTYTWFNNRSGIQYTQLEG
ncbi:hypothetical protein F0L74_04285 [Chitinophaga agrisoli]|uniref:Uncharacterized protein n=1 Tax=Chitinophaga agrisoli TaxID=2607653 RepID=A0A5B2W3R6_9BACT|nr:hypothetical protein [Chitinophaga agrisoli]KAA2245186.1 hypothetical protein F0L74_04285 [Chitinophaga agrisoli]